jgi:predicted O-methyltransferase YrrM
MRYKRSGGVMPLCPRRGITRDHLAQTFKALGYTLGVEIGTHKGKYAKILCATNPGLHLICVDPWKAYLHLSQAVQDALFEQTRQRLKPYNTEILVTTSMEAVKRYPDGALDFVFIDGDHDYAACNEDIIAWAPKVKHGGIIAAHDYYNRFWPGVTDAVNEYIKAHSITPWYVTRDRLATAFWVNP